ncbi:hypothetical protein EDB86DRAFT_3137739 [Lactarius hatsudake]|nr:hypothetical protein EDB86DRAFT_3137739 [Lactarius hatsudake]
MPGPRDAVVKRFDPSTPACDAGIVPCLRRFPPVHATHPGPSHPSSPLTAYSAAVEGFVPSRVGCLNHKAIALPAREPVRPDTGISITTMAILNSFVNDIRPSSPRPDTGISNKTEAMNSFVNDICPLLTITRAQRCSQRDRLQVRPAYLGDRCPLTRPRSSHPRTRRHSHSAHRYFQQDRGHPEGHPELLCQRHFRTVRPVYLGDRYPLAPLTLARDATHTVHTGISNKTAAILNSFVNDIFERIAKNPPYRQGKSRLLFV